MDIISDGFYDDGKSDVLAVRIWHVTNVVCIFTEAACLKV
jgi:hypothetical protein